MITRPLGLEADFYPTKYEKSEPITTMLSSRARYFLDNLNGVISTSKLLHVFVHITEKAAEHFLPILTHMRAYVYDECDKRGEEQVCLCEQKL